jgi:hypothetical protein
MPVNECIKIIEELNYVDYVFKSIDLDRTVCKTIETLILIPIFLEWMRSK